MLGGESFFPWRRLTDAQPPALSRQCRLNQSIIAERLILSYLSEMLLSIPRLIARSAARSFSRKPRGRSSSVENKSPNLGRRRCRVDARGNAGTHEVAGIY